MFTTRPAAEALAPFVSGYWFVEDLAGAHPRDVPIHTVPRPGAVLTVHLGRPNEGELPIGAPAVSLLGVQSRARAWWSRGDCYLVMVMLSLPGVLRLFPALGEALGDGMLELGSTLGDRATRRLRADVVGAFTPDRIAGRLDAWLLARLESLPAVDELAGFTHAFDALARTGRVDDAAAAAGISRRRVTWATPRRRSRACSACTRACTPCRPAPPTRATAFAIRRTRSERGAGTSGRRPAAMHGRRWRSASSAKAWRTSSDRRRVRSIRPVSACRTVPG